MKTTKANRAGKGNAAAIRGYVQIKYWVAWLVGERERRDQGLVPAGTGERLGLQNEVAITHFS